MSERLNQTPDFSMDNKKYPFWLEVTPLVLTIIVLVIQFSLFDSIEPYIPLVFGIVITGIIIKIKGLRWMDMENHFYKIVKISLPVLMLLMDMTSRFILPRETPDSEVPTKWEGLK